METRRQEAIVRVQVSGLTDLVAQQVIKSGDYF